MIVTCEQAGLSLHAYIDGELDANRVTEVEGHLATCSHCTAQIRQYRYLQRVLTSGAAYQTPEGLRRRIEVAFPSPRQANRSRRTLLQGFVMGAVLSTAAAASLSAPVFREKEEQRIVDEIISAHVRSLRSGPLIGVQSSDQPTITP